MAVTFLVVFPFTQEMVTFFLATGATTGDSDGDGDGAGETTFSCESFTLIVGEEKLNPLADK